jgi:ribose transport system permease protein
VTVAKLEPFIVTLGTLTMAQGAGYYLSGASPIALTGSAALPWLNGSIWGVPVIVAVFVGAVIIGQAILSRTVFGRELYIIGGNEEAAHYAGIPVARRRFAIYVVAGLCASVAALLVIAQLQTASPNFGTTYNLSAIAAVVVGGTPLTGGRGSVLGTTVGVLIIALVSDLLGLLNVGTYIQLMVTGLIVIIVVSLNRSGRAGQPTRRGWLRVAVLLAALLVASFVMFDVFGSQSVI